MLRPVPVRPRHLAAKGARSAEGCKDSPLLNRWISHGRGATAKTQGHSHSSMSHLVLTDPVFSGFKKTVADRRGLALIEGVELSEGSRRDLGAA